MFQAAVLTDLASMHGSCVNGTQLEKNIRRPLKHGDVLTFGTGVLRGEGVYSWDSLESSS